MIANPSLSPRRHAVWLWSSLVGWFGAYVLALAASEMTAWPRSVRIALSLLPVPAFASFLGALVTRVRRMDELERRIHLEALAVAFPLGILLLMTLGLLQRVVTLSMEDWSYRHVWGYFPLLYFIGLWLARRRYA
jgi:hypothetical protein